MRLDHNNYLYGLMFKVLQFSTNDMQCHEFIEINFGGDCEEVTPVPIPNTEVKLLRADGTAWATVWESRCRRI